MHRTAILAFAAALAACGAGAAVESPALNESCPSTLDAIGYRCASGTEFSVRYAPEADCAVVFAASHTYVLAATGDETYSNGAVTLRAREHGASTSLAGAAADYEQCTWLLE